MSYQPAQFKLLNLAGIQESLTAMRFPKQSIGDSIGDTIGENDKKLAQRLIKSGDDHAKAIRGIVAWVEIGMQVGFMIEFETYRIGVECLSTTSSMYGELRPLKGVALADQKQKDLPTKYYKRIATINYQAMRRMYYARRFHKHPDWRIFAEFVESLPHFETFIKPRNERRN